MQYYLLVILADILLAAVWACQNQYQKKVGVSLEASLRYGVALGAVKTLLFFMVCGGSVEVSGFSLLMALGVTIPCTVNVLLSFGILKRGNMPLYTQFLMSGGMLVPYIWGVAFLEEPLTLLRTAGVLLIVGAIILSNTGAKRPDSRQLLACIVVFFSNGAVSVVSKMHAIDAAHGAVEATDFVFWTAAVSAVVPALLLLGGKVLGQKDICRQGDGTGGPAGRITGKVLATFLLIIASAAVADGVSYLCQVIGAANLPASVIYPLVTGGSVIISALAGKLLFKEKLPKRQWIGLAVCFAGTCLFL